MTIKWRYFPVALCVLSLGVETRTFGPGEPAVFVSREISNAPAGSKARISWATLPGKKQVSRQEAKIVKDKPK